MTELFSWMDLNNYNLSRLDKSVKDDNKFKANDSLYERIERLNISKGNLGISLNNPNSACLLGGSGMVLVFGQKR